MVFIEIDFFSKFGFDSITMSDELGKHGLFFDYLYNLRVLDPNVSNETADLKEQSGEYSESKQFKLNIVKPHLFKWLRNEKKNI